MPQQKQRFQNPLQRVLNFDVGHVKESPKVRTGDIVGSVPKLCFVEQNQSSGGGDPLS